VTSDHLAGPQNGEAEAGYSYDIIEVNEED